MKRIDDWILDERIGSGGLAEVWKGHREGETHHYALKVLREPDRSRAHRARFLREGRLLSHLDHPGLPQCPGVGDGEQPYLILELLEGETLANRIRTRGPVPPDQVATIAAQILRTLDYLHGHGIVHRDIKASNIYLANDRRILLLDLGLAADPNDPLTTTLGDVMGTYAYMAPEQIAGAYVDHRCDLYSLGITLYEALAGTRPFHARGSQGYLRAHREGITTPLNELVSDAPARLLDMVARLMARDPVARPASAAIARAMLTGATGAKRSLRQAPLVGRAAAIGVIHAVLDAGGTAILLGELGAGAGRMASYALMTAREQAMETIAIRCRGRAPPLDPVEQLVRDLSTVVGPVEMSGDDLARATEALAAEGPLLIIVEDVEQCSPEAARLLAPVFQRRPGLSVVITGVEAPPEFLGHRVRLRQLELDETLALVSAMLGTPTPPAGLGAELHRMSGGLPAIVVLAMKELVSRGALWCEGISDDGQPSWRLDRNVALEPTTGLVRLFGAALTALPEPSRNLVDVLAVVGEAIPLEIALSIAECDPSGVALGPLLKAGLVGKEDRDRGEWVVLRRPAVGALVIGQVPPARRTAIHAAMADALALEPPQPWRDERLAWHRAHGAPPSDAPRALQELGEALGRRGQYTRALEVLDKASKIPGASTRVAADIAISRGEVLEAVGRRDEAATALGAGLRLAEELGDIALIGRAMVAQAQVQQGLGDERRAALLAEEALELLEDRPTDPSLPRALLLAANSHRMGARPEQAARLFGRCRQVALDQGAREYAALANGGLGSIFMEEGHLQQAIHHFEREAIQLRALGLPHHLVSSLFRLAQAHLRTGRPDRALDALEEARQCARFAQMPYMQSLVHIGQATVALRLGDRGETERRLNAGRIALEPEASAHVRLAYRDVQGELRLVSGDRQAALAVFQAAQSEAERAGFAAVSSFFVGMIGVLTADPEAITEAMDVLAIAGDRRLAARLLLFGATVGGDAEVLESAERETRASGDRFLLLEVLHASGSASHLEEARSIAEQILPFAPPGPREAFLALAPVRWAGLR